MRTEIVPLEKLTHSDRVQIIAGLRRDGETEHADEMDALDMMIGANGCDTLAELLRKRPRIREETRALHALHECRNWLELISKKPEVWAAAIHDWDAVSTAAMAGEALS